MLHHDTGWPTEHQGVPGHAPTMTHHKVQSPAKKGLLLSRGLLGLPGQRCAVADPSQVSPRLPMAGGGGPAPPWAWVSSVKCGIALPSSPGGRDGEMSLPCWEAGASGAVSTRNGTAGPEEHRAQVRTEVGWHGRAEGAPCAGQDGSGGRLHAQGGYSSSSHPQAPGLTAWLCHLLIVFSSDHDSNPAP